MTNGNTLTLQPILRIHTSMYALTHLISRLLLAKDATQTSMSMGSGVQNFTAINSNNQFILWKKFLATDQPPHLPFNHMLTPAIPPSIFVWDGT